MFQVTFSIFVLQSKNILFQGMIPKFGDSTMDYPVRSYAMETKDSVSYPQLLATSHQHAQMGLEDSSQE